MLIVNVAKIAYLMVQEHLLFSKYKKPPVTPSSLEALIDLLASLTVKIIEMYDVNVVSSCPLYVVHQCSFAV